MSLLEEAYHELRRFKMVDNQCEFSTKWLNKSKRYYSMVLATGREPSVDTLARLAANLKQRHDICRNSRYGELRLKADWIRPLMKKTWRELFHRAQDWPFERHGN